MTCEVGGRTVAVLWGVASRICSRQHEAILCSSLQALLYIYIYISSLRKKPKTGYFRIINLFASCFVFLM